MAPGVLVPHQQPSQYPAPGSLGWSVYPAAPAAAVAEIKPVAPASIDGKWRLVGMADVSESISGKDFARFVKAGGEEPIIVLRDGKLLSAVMFAGVDPEAASFRLLTDPAGGIDLHGNGKTSLGLCGLENDGKRLLLVVRQGDGPRPTSLEKLENGIIGLTFDRVTDEKK